MPLFELHCQYCGKRWEAAYYFNPNKTELTCPVCKDHNIKAKLVDDVKKDKDVFGYNKTED